MKLGKKPARPGAITLKFADIIDASKLPTPPSHFGHQGMIANNAWGMLGNDNVGDCVLAGGAHEHMLFSLEGQHGKVVFDTKGVISDYSAITGYDPNDPNSDQGTDMQQAASYRRKVGLIDSRGVRHKVDAYCEIGLRDLSQLNLAVWLFGAAGIGIQFPNTAMDQFNAGKVWDVVPGATIEGGHYVPIIGKHTDGHYVLVTWGKEILATTRFIRKYMDEGVAYISRDVLLAKTAKTDEGFDIAALDSFLKQLG